jgi:hypothetical protein
LRGTSKGSLIQVGKLGMNTNCFHIQYDIYYLCA